MQYVRIANYSINKGTFQEIADNAKRDPRLLRRRAGDRLATRSIRTDRDAHRANGRGTEPTPVGSLLAVMA